MSDKKFTFLRAILPYYLSTSPEFLSPHPAISAAYVLWASVKRKARPRSVDVVKCDKSYLWFGGFDGLITETGGLEARLHRRLPKDFVDEAWAEAASADGVQDIGNWYQKLTLFLPEDQKRRLFGPRGLTKSSAARAAGITRPTLYAALRATE